MMSKKFINAVSLCLLSLALAACSGPDIKPVKETTVRPGIPSSKMAQVEHELLQAEASIAPQRQRHQLKAAKLLDQTGDPVRATSILASIEHNVLPLSDLVDYSLLYTRLALSRDDFFLARQLLTNPRLEQQQHSIAPDSKKQWLEQRGDLFALLGEDRNSIDAYIAVAELADEQLERTLIHDKLWQVLTNIPQQTLLDYSTSEKRSVQKGWYSLANISRETQSDIRQLLSQIDHWHKQWPDHPAAGTMPSNLGGVSQVINQLPRQVALLLPMKGSLAQAGTTIRDGFLSAWYNNYAKYGDTPAIKVYDTSSNSVTDLYQQAIADGADIVIGPLQKGKVRELFLLDALPIPTIALNYVGSTVEVPQKKPAEPEPAPPTSSKAGPELEETIEDVAIDEPVNKPKVKMVSRQTPKNLYQFGLSATDEAKQIAERAWIEGQRTALAIVPNSSWGDRALETFRSDWLARGGILHVADPYDKRQIDFAPLLKPALHIHHSEQRTQRLERILGKPIKSMPRRRQDLDMVFMVAYPNHARQIKPTLDFLFANDLQIYGTSQLYSGENDPGRNRDLEGIRFSAMPWTLPGVAVDNFQFASDMAPLYRHMFALGVDTYQLHQWLQQMAQVPNTQLFGSTGALQLLPDNTIARQQPWAVFRGGRVRLAPQLTDE